MTSISDAELEKRLAGLRILVVEDEAAIAMLVEDMLQDFGCKVVGPVGRVKDALALADNAPLDAAVLDVNVAGESIQPVVTALLSRQIPVVFSTGYGAHGLSEEHRTRPVLHKPFGQRDLLVQLLAALNPGEEVSPPE